jgi:DUF2892 family protein
MLKTNVGTLDRVLRIGLGIALLAWMLAGEGDARWWGAIGLIPLVTGMLGFCPLYRLLGLRTCPLARSSG